MNDSILPQSLEKAIGRLNEQLVESLGDSLYSCILFGSAVRGDFTAQSSDLNLLIILNDTSPKAHDLIAEVLSDHTDIRVDPMVLGRSGIKRSFEMFGPKFLSISRNYRVLHGADLFKGLVIDNGILKFLAEQTLRNLRMSAVRAYTLYSRDRTQYVRYVNRMRASIFTALSDVVRLSNDADVPHNFSDRPKVIEEFFKTDASVLTDFLQLSGRGKLSTQEIQSLHLGLFNLLNHAILWVESHWAKNDLN